MGDALNPLPIPVALSWLNAGAWSGIPSLEGLGVSPGSAGASQGQIHFHRCTQVCTEVCSEVCMRVHVCAWEHKGVTYLCVGVCSSEHSCLLGCALGVCSGVQGGTGVPCRAMLCWVTSHRAVPSHCAVPYCAVSCCARSHSVMPSHIILFHAMSFHSTLCHSLPYHVTLCQAVPAPWIVAPQAGAGAIWALLNPLRWFSWCQHR